MVLAAVNVATLLVATAYYYNKLLALQFDVELARARIEAGEQRRNHVTRNLSQFVRFYARYESGVMHDATKLRVDGHAPSAAQPSANDTIGQLLGRLNAVAEQYPNLRLTNSVQLFTSVVVSTESEIAAYEISYNDAVNMYATALNTFPAKVFGKLLGFKRYPFYKPEEPATLPFKELQL